MEEITETRVPTLQEINAHTHAIAVKLGALTTAIQMLSKIIETELRAAYEAGDDVSEYTVKLVKTAKKTEEPEETPEDKTDVTDKKKKAVKSK